MDVTIDFETQSEANLKKVGAYEYSVHPTTRVLCMAFSSGYAETPKLLNFTTMQKPWAEMAHGFKSLWSNWIFSSVVTFKAHNAFFEQCVYNNVLVKRLGWPPIPANKWSCNAAKCAAAALPRNLADAGAVLRTSVQKDFLGHRIMMKLCKPTPAWARWKKANDEIKSGKRVGIKKREIAEKPEPVKFFTPENAPEEFKILYHYCKLDVLTEEKIDELLPELTPFERKVWLVDQKINLRGVSVDTELVNKIAGIMADESKTMTKELDILTMGLVSSGNARNAILDFLSLDGIELPDLRAKTVDDFLENGIMTGDAEKVLKIRKSLSKSSTAKYKMFQERAASDGRVRDILLYWGAQRTGRWGGKGVQPQNFPRGIVKDIYEAIERIKTCSVDDLKLLYGENLMPLFSSVLRGMFVATKGCEMFVEDYSAIECRVAWWLAGHEAGLKMFREGRDPYKEMAVEIYNKPIFEITDDERQVGKAAVLGCGYQMGFRKFVTSAWDVYRAKVDIKMAKVAVQAYRKVHWPVQEIWEQYQTAAIEAVKNPGEVYAVGKVKFFKKSRWLFIELPSGRRLAYCDPKIIIEPTVILELNGERVYAPNITICKDFQSQGAEIVGQFESEKLTYWEVNQMAKKSETEIPKWALERTYGGKIFENVTQAVSRDILACAIVRAEGAGFNVLMHSHDELVSEAPKGEFTSEEYRELMEVVPKWAKGLPLKSGGWKDVRYRKG